MKTKGRPKAGTSPHQPSRRPKRPDATQEQRGDTRIKAASRTPRNARERRRTDDELRALVKTKPNGHWAMCELSQRSADHGRAKTAKRLASRAARLAPKCPLVRWTAVVADLALGDFESAAVGLRSIIRSGVRGLLSDPCGRGEGREWVRRLVNHAQLLLAEGFLRKGDLRRAKYYSNAFLEGTMEGSTDQALFHRNLAVMLQLGTAERMALRAHPTPRQ